LKITDSAFELFAKKKGISFHAPQKLAERFGIKKSINLCTILKAGKISAERNILDKKRL